MTQPAGAPVGREATDAMADRDSVLGKAVGLLDVIATARSGLTASELVAVAGLPKATVYRLVAQLVDTGLVERDGSRYQVGLRVFELGHRAARRRIVLDSALPYMYELRRATGRTVHLAVLLGREVMCLEKLLGTAKLPLTSRVGARTPAHVSGVGRVLLAYVPANARVPELARVRAGGVAVKGSARSGGLLCAAAPVIGGDTEAVAAVSVSGWASGADVAGLVRSVQEAAAAISRVVSAPGAAAQR